MPEELAMPPLGAPTPGQRDPTVRELRATLNALWDQTDNVGATTQAGRLYRRAYDHLAWTIDAFLFDVDPFDDDGGRAAE